MKVIRRVYHGLWQRAARSSAINHRATLVTGEGDARKRSFRKRPQAEIDDLDVHPGDRNPRAMSERRLALRNWLFWLVLIVWLATAIPIALLSLVTLELPLWPSLSAETTREGITIWAVFAAWFYITPLVLALVVHRRRKAGSKLERR